MSAVSKIVAPPPQIPLGFVATGRQHKIRPTRTKLLTAEYSISIAHRARFFSNDDRAIAMNGQTQSAAIITGGGRGISRAITLRLARVQAVVVVGRTEAGSLPAASIFLRKT